MGRVLGLLLAFLSAGVIMLVVGADNYDTPEPDATARKTRDKVARQRADDAAAAQAALTAAAFTAVIKAFDDTDIVRNRAIRKARQELKSIRINTAQLASNEATRVAGRLAQPSMIPRLGYAYGMDLITEGDRVWTLFDEAMGPGMERVVENDAARYSKQLRVHRRELLKAQDRFGTELNHAVAPLGSRNMAALSPVSNKFPPFTLEPKIQRRVLAAIWSRLRSRFPGALKRGAVKLGMKEVARAPGAAIDGPIPIVETGLVLWGIYDAVGSAAWAWTAARHQIAYAAADEVNGVAQSQLKAAAEQLFAAEKEGRDARCAALAAALKPLAVASKDQEYARRCGRGA